MKTSLPLALLCALALAMAIACGESAPKPKNSASTASKKAADSGLSTGGTASTAATTTATGAAGGTSSTLTNREDLKKAIVQLMTKEDESKKEYAILSLINQRMCERLQKLRNDCAPSVRVIPESSEKILGCIGNVEDGAKNAVTFQVALGGTGGEYKLVADNTYETIAFRDGETAVKWTTNYNTDVLSPRLMELTNLRLKATSGTVAPLANISFELRVNGKAVLTKSDLTTSTSGDTSFYLINPINFLNLRRSDACRVSAAEIDSVREQARKDAAAQQAASGSTPLAGLGLAEGAQSVRVEFISKRIFRAIIGRYPLLDATEKFTNSPLREIALQVNSLKYEAAARALLDYPGFRKILPDEAKPITDKELAKDIVRRAYHGILELSPDEKDVPGLAGRVQAGERARLVAELIANPRFQQYLAELGD